MGAPLIWVRWQRMAAIFASHAADTATASVTVSSGTVCRWASPREVRPRGEMRKPGRLAGTGGWCPRKLLAYARHLPFSYGANRRDQGYGVRGM